jgi:hypothetical protein
MHGLPGAGANLDEHLAKVCSGDGEEGALIVQ